MAFKAHNTEVSPARGKVGLSNLVKGKVRAHVNIIEGAEVLVPMPRSRPRVGVMSQPRLRRLATPLAMFACCLALSIVCNAECRRALEAEVPHGANELIERKEQTVNRVVGTIPIGFRDSAPTPNVVVEVYRSIANQDFHKTVQQNRLTVCVTGPDGRFSFPELKPGRYLLHVGMKEPDRINETYVPIIVKSRWKGPKGRRIRIVLQLGT
jgi:hypothetical protein